MAGYNHEPTADDIRAVIERVDQVCREAELARTIADEALRRPPVWPERADARSPYLGIRSGD